MADIIKFKPKPTELDDATDTVLIYLDDLLEEIDSNVRVAVSVVLQDKKKEKRVVSVNNKTFMAQVTKYPPPETKE